MIAVVRCFGVRDPMAVGRPCVIVDVVVKPFVNEDRLLLLNVNIEEARLLVGKHQLLAVGRPDRRQAKHLAVRRDPDLLTQTVLRRHVQLVFASPVRDVCHPTSVRRPSCVLLANSRRPRQVTDAAFLGRNREDVAPRGENRSLAVR